MSVPCRHGKISRFCGACYEVRDARLAALREALMVVSDEAQTSYQLGERLVSKLKDLIEREEEK